ncbi:hypothetical protein M758_9G132100 [Ceratodon purpureus]|nr:hypothetical protein M758_9G132100 [Ceratodon purpureus]
MIAATRTQTQTQTRARLLEKGCLARATRWSHQWNKREGIWTRGMIYERDGNSTEYKLIILHCCVQSCLLRAAWHGMAWVGIAWVGLAMGLPPIHPEQEGWKKPKASLSGFMD